RSRVTARQLCGIWPGIMTSGCGKRWALAPHSVRHSVQPRRSRIEGRAFRCYALGNRRRDAMNVNTKPDKTFKLEMVHPDPSQAHKMPYAPAIKIVGACDLMFLSG